MKKTFGKDFIYIVLCFLTTLNNTQQVWAATKKQSSATSVSNSVKDFTSPSSPINFSAISSSTSPSVPQICINGIKAGSPTSSSTSASIENLEEEEFVEVIEGDITISVMTKDPISVLFAFNRINQGDLISGDFLIGSRVIDIRYTERLEYILLQEVEFLQHCVEKPVGIFIDNDLYKLIEHLVQDIEYNIWPLPSSRTFVFPKVAHLLYQMPWGNHSASVEILAESGDVYNDFMNAARNEHLCLMHFRSADNIYVLLGNKLVSNFKENGTIFAVPTGRTDKSFISDLPHNSYVLMESEVELKAVNENGTQQTLYESIMGKNILSSDLLAISGPFLDFAKWLNESLTRNCLQTSGIFHLETCHDFLIFVGDWTANRKNYRPSEILDLLKIRNLGHYMTFEMFQKVVTKPNNSENTVELREIASQSFITNITTYFHYNPANETTHEMKTKFGHIFSCQYADGTNRKFPFYFEGESVMYWRLKQEAWVAAGLTASSLGIIISLAILIFIIIRISIGDVFEGNPLSSIMLLVALTLLFGSFVPFAIEYISDHRNSYVTFEDTETMNTLCAVRIFLVTLCYCITFSLLLCRAIMLASIGSEGGFLSHVNGYIQSVICLFSTLVQIGLSTQLIIVMHIAHESISCENIFYGHWLWGLLAYDLILLFFFVLLTPLIFRSQRNYREGILLVIGAILCFAIWCTWIPMSFFGHDWRDAAIPLGAQATGWAILAGVLIPRTFLIVRGIERSDIAQALPSLTSLAFAQNNQYASEQSVYECVNPAMRGSREDGMYDGHMQSPSEIPTLPLRGNTGGRRQLFGNLRHNNNVSTNIRRHSASSSQSSIPPSPNKITRF